MQDKETALKGYPYDLLTDYFLTGYHIAPEQKYEIFTIPARNLLLPQRWDLMAKWVYIDSFEKRMDMQSAKELYLKHIEAFTEGSFVEPGNEEKNSAQKFIDAFEQMIDEFRDGQFDDTISLIPVGKDNVLLDGAHRCVCAAYYDKDVTVIKFPQIDRKYDYIFFKSRTLDEIYMDRMALEYCHLNEHLHFACFWPIADDEGLRKQATHILREECGEIIYEKDVYLGYRGLLNFMLQIYGHQNWTGSYENQHSGTKGKADKCYLKGKPTHIVIFECSSLETVIKAKEKIRNLFSLENHAIHISDDDKEARLMADLLLNQNSIHHLRYANPDAYIGFNQLFDEYRGKLENYTQKQNYIIDSSCVLSVYGLRDCRDLDFLTTDAEWEKIMPNCGGIDNHQSQLCYYPVSLNDIINNPQNYFVYQGMKFVSLSVLKTMKQCRGEKKDMVDIRMIEQFEKRGKLFFKPVHNKKKCPQICIKDIILQFKCKRKRFLESMLKHKWLGKILLIVMYPIAKIMRKKDKWDDYYVYWEEHNY